LWGIIGEGLFQWGHDGKFDSGATLRDDLIMYKEVKVMTVDEFYGEWYYSAGLSAFSFAHKLAAAIKAGEVE
jgi:hypothetical protein